ncbi:uncharacterized protein LOC117174437 [Belonocnema kinseyi]|uniref:uncharacterized protein LOC117174437 n=1 Tax=Belonocnema kinseyi TaxID=2817044 RepID=UPI00143D4DCE|nr:uncharacterized protein LOC117174437 [Belonocnema kinseyi]
MKFIIFVVAIATIATAGECIVCYQCVDGEKTDELQSYQSCNKFLDNHTCNTTASSACATYSTNYLHRRTVLHDCVREENPFKHGNYDIRICKTNYCNRDENWGRYNGVSSVSLPTSLGLVLLVPLYFI